MKAKVPQHPFRACMRIRVRLSVQAAFTLIELLTVITIVGILAAILIPVTGKMRSSARSSHCLSNLRQIGSGFNIYAQEHQQKYPAPQNGATNYYWYEVLQPYTNTKVDIASLEREDLNPVFFCPEWRLHETEWGTDSTNIGYAMSTMLSGTVDVTKSVMIDQIGNPTQALLLIENPISNPAVFPPTGVDDLEVMKSLLFGSTDQISQGSGRHNHRANYLFADGHVHGCTVEEAQMMFEEAK